MNADELYELSYLDPIETHEDMVTWLVTQYENASSESVKTGRQWYPLAARIARKIARNHGLTFRQAAGILAAFSQNATWKANVALAHAYASGSPRGLSKVLTECDRIANGEKPSNVIGHMPKVIEFYRSIIGHENACTMDRWALEAAYGCRVTPSLANQRKAQAAYREAAQRVREASRDFQAIIWIEARGAAF